MLYIGCFASWGKKQVLDTSLFSTAVDLDLTHWYTADSFVIHLQECCGQRGCSLMYEYQS